MGKRGITVMVPIWVRDDLTCGSIEKIDRKSVCQCSTPCYDPTRNHIKSLLRVALIMSLWTHSHSKKNTQKICWLVSNPSLLLQSYCQPPFFNHLSISFSHANLHLLSYKGFSSLMTPAGYHELPNSLAHEFMSPVDSDTRRTVLDVPPLCQSGVATLQEAELRPGPWEKHGKMTVGKDSLR